MKHDFHSDSEQNCCSFVLPSMIIVDGNSTFRLTVMLCWRYCSRHDVTACITVQCKNVVVVVGVVCCCCCPLLLSIVRFLYFRPKKLSFLDFWFPYLKIVNRFSEILDIDIDIYKNVTKYVSMKCRYLKPVCTL